MTANDRKRPLWSRCRLAAYSLHARARRRASSSFWPNQTPGLRTETTAVSMPALSMSSSDMSTVHLVGEVLLWLARAWAWTGGTMWGWTSIRRGFSGACLEAGGMAVVAPAEPHAGAAGAPRTKILPPPGRPPKNYPGLPPTHPSG